MKKTNVVKYFYDIYIYNYVIVNVITEFLFYCLKTAKTFPKIAKMFCNPKFWMFMLKIEKKKIPLILQIRNSVIHVLGGTHVY